MPGITLPLSDLASSGGVSLVMRYGLGILISCANMVVLTRWIGPHSYGLFVTAAGLSSFLASLSRAGIDTYLVRAEAVPDHRSYSTAMTLILALSLGLGLAGIAMVPLLTRWYGSSEFVAPYLVSLLTIPLAGLAGPPTAKLERELEFTKVAHIELTGQIIALLISTLLARTGFGVWAPVLGLVAWQVWAASAALYAAKLAIRPVLDMGEARKMLSFGLGYSASIRIWQLRTLINPLLVGRFAGPDGVAFVGLAIRISEGLGFVRIAAGRLAIAAFSRLRQNTAAFQSTLQKALRLQILALGPLLCIFAVVAPIVVPWMFGSRWTMSLQLYPFVAASVLVNSLYNLRAAALFVVGRQWIVLRAYALHVALLGIATLLFLPRWGIAGYGWAELAACAGYAPLHTTAGAFNFPVRKLVRLTLGFLVPPFYLLTDSHWAILLWLPLLWSVCAELQQRRRGQSRHLAFPSLTESVCLPTDFRGTGT